MCARQSGVEFMASRIWEARVMRGVFGGHRSHPRTRQGRMLWDRWIYCAYCQLGTFLGPEPPVPSDPRLPIVGGLSLVSSAYPLDLGSPTIFSANDLNQLACAQVSTIHKDGIRGQVSKEFRSWLALASATLWGEVPVLSCRNRAPKGGYSSLRSCPNSTVTCLIPADRLQHSLPPFPDSGEPSAMN